MRRFENLKMVKGVIAMSSVLFLLFGCKDNESGSQGLQNELFCDADFDVFFEKFRSDSIFQKNHVRFPLQMTYPDPERDLHIVREDIPEAEYSFSEFKNDKEIGDTGNGTYQIDIIKKKDSVYYQMNGIDNGISTKATFILINGCWNMVEIADTST